MLSFFANYADSNLVKPDDDELQREEEKMKKDIDECLRQSQGVPKGDKKTAENDTANVGDLNELLNANVQWHPDAMISDNSDSVEDVIDVEMQKSKAILIYRTPYQ